MHDTVTFFYLLLSFSFLFSTFLNMVLVGQGAGAGAGRHRASLCLAWFRVSQLFFDVTKFQRRCDICDELVSVFFRYFVSVMGASKMASSPSLD